MSESRLTFDSGLDAGALKGEAAGRPSNGITSRAAWVRYAVPVALAILAILVFMPALDAGFAWWDDDDLIHGQFHHLTFTSDNLAWMFGTTFGGHYQPLTWISYALDRAVFSLDPFGYHLTNVVWHILTMVAFYAVVRRLLALGTDNRLTFDSAPVMMSAAFAALVFGIHPLRAESVAWIAERRDVLSGFFCVASIACYVRYAASVTGALSPGEDIHDWSTERRFYVASIFLCLVSLMAKATAMTLPFVLIILDVYPLKRLHPGRLHRGGGMRRIGLEKIPFLVLAAVAGVIAIVAQSSGGSMYSMAEHDLVARLAQASYGLVFYLWKTLWPAGLGPLYEIPARGILVGRLLWFSLPVVIVLAAISVWRARVWPCVAAALSCYAVIVAPVLGFVQSGPQLVADRYSYLSCMGLAVLAGAVLLTAMRHAPRSGPTLRRAGILLVVGVVISALAKSTMAQAEYWKMPLTLWRRGVQISPNSAIANTNYADALAALGTQRSLALAERFYRTALKINLNDPVALHHYGDLLKRTNRIEDAISLYRRSLVIDPTRHRACLSLGQCLVDMDYPQMAVAVLRDGARRRPDAIDLYEYLSRLLATHPDETIRNGEEALALARHVIQARGNGDVNSSITLSYALAENGQFELAVKAAQHAASIAEVRGFEQLAETIRNRITLFQEGKPYHNGP